MTASGRLAMMRIGFSLLGLLLALWDMPSACWAGADAPVSRPTASLPDLEHLIQQIENPDQREVLLKTLRALNVTVKQSQPAAAPEDKVSNFGDRSQGVFFAFRELTEYLSAEGRQLGLELAALRMTLRDLPVRLAERVTLGLLIHTAVDVGLIVILGLILRLIAFRIEVRVRDNARAFTEMPLWRKSWHALHSVGLTIGPYLIILLPSGIVLSIFPVGAILSGLIALVLFTLLGYRLMRALGHVLLCPDDSTSRLLPISDASAELTWIWFMRLVNLSVAYYLITQGLMVIGIANELYYLVRGGLLVLFPILLSILIVRLTRSQRTNFPETAKEVLEGPWGRAAFALLRIWPLIAITYVWSTAVFAIAEIPQGMRYMLVGSLETAGAILAILLVLRATSLLFMKAFVINDRVGEFLAGLQVHTRRYLQVIWDGVRVAVILIGIALVLQIWGVATSWFLASPIGSDILSRFVALGFTLAIVALILDLSAFARERFTELGPDHDEVSRKRKTLIPLACTVIKYAALITGGLIVLYEVGVNITPILAGVGILSLAIGFGAQTLVKDIINGLFILFEDSIAVGDTVSIKGTSGQVEAVNLRTIRLRDLQGSVHIVPNSQVEMITNMTKEFSYCLLNVGVPYREDTDTVVATLKELDAAMREDLAFAGAVLTPIEILGVDGLTDSAVIIQARIKTKPGRQWYVGREFKRRMKKLFEDRGIEIKQC